MARQLRRFEPQEFAVGTDGELAISLDDASGTPLNVTGASAEWKLFKAVPRRRRKPFTGNAVLEKTSAAGGIALENGLATVSIADTDLDGKSGAHWHVIRITDSAGTVTHFGQGELFLRAAA